MRAARQGRTLTPILGMARLLLDTCALLWWVTGDARIRPAIARRLEREDSELFLSVASAWEIAVKVKLGKLELPSAPLAFIREAAELYRITLLPIELEDAVCAGELPLHHKDPFDRQIIAQAMRQKLAAVTPDPLFRPYGVRTIW